MLRLKAVYNLIQMEQGKFKHRKSQYSIKLLKLPKKFFLFLLIFPFSPRSIKSLKQTTKSLSVVPVQATDIPPKETVTYSKQTQTANTGGVERDG